MEKRERAYAKVNIGLKVGEKRSDGYHNIDSYFLRIPFYDSITFSLKEGPLHITIKGNDSYIQGGQDIMEKAAKLYSERTGITFSLEIEIEKEIPFKAGLGGGSSDAASTLLFLNDYFQALNEEELIKLSSSVGADVPFFVSKCNLAHVGGLGEIVTPVSYSLPYKYVSLFRAKDSEISTKEAYSRLDERKTLYTSLPSLSYPLKREDFPNDFEILDGGDMLRSIKKVVNDNDFISLSGSGSVWYVLSEKKMALKSEDFISCRPIFMD